MAKYLETGIKVRPSEVISEAIDLYNAINSLSSFPKLQENMLLEFEILLYKIVAEIPQNYVNYMWMNMVSVFQFHSGYFHSEVGVDMEMMNYHHVKKAVQKILTCKPYLKDGKVIVESELVYLFNGSDSEENKKYGYYNLALGDSNPRSFLMDYIEEAIKEDPFIKKRTLPLSPHYYLSKSF
jgi:hypothetical protein